MSNSGSSIRFFLPALPPVPDRSWWQPSRMLAGVVCLVEAATEALPCGSTSDLTNQPFGVNLILDGIEEDQIDICLAERVPVLVFF